MFFWLLKSYARLAIRLYCSTIIINKPQYLKARGPLLLSANHPNSFLDGIILTTLFDQHIYSLARGDAFKHPWANRMLRWLHLAPVYRTREGAENLEHNYTTFASCIEIFKKNGIVLIFSEGLCENEWHLRPLPKGTARLATSAWQQDIPLQVLPVGINYDSFKKFGKEVHLLFGNPFSHEVVAGHETDGKQNLYFNTELKNQLQSLVYEIPSEKDPVYKQYFKPTVSLWKRVLLFFPALVGLLLHYPLYVFARLVTNALFKKSGHFDSVLHALPMLLYPLYLLGFVLAMAYSVSLFAALPLFVFMPLTAWCLAQLNFTLFGKS
ncbi:1-acyl-sn-glycerol-3-phosphate acyltransferase [Flavisolibacter tropicus]|uniref:1-acyl-sn-glycerol-3-phosphate acyltransferase n=1 Tax=Flavisolibacter tropicus TaxID=1492898 RepID=UPI000834DA4D|nr:1-acyl-sn-glycerol-3-phosphate acyltransferase [Flavisolibacter tropicus]